MENNNENNEDSDNTLKFPIDKLNLPQEEKIIEEDENNFKCKVCDFSIAKEEVLVLNVAVQGSTSKGPTLMPVPVTVCTNCGALSMLKEVVENINQRKDSKLIY